MEPLPVTASVTTPTRIDRALVLDTAAGLADEHGFENLTLAMVAGELGIRSQSLYSHVEGIDGLREGLALRAQALLADELRDAAMARTGVAALRSVVRALADFASDHPGLYRASLRPPEASPEMRTANEHTVAPLMAVLESFGLEGEDLQHHYRIIWSSVHGFVTLRQAGLLRWPADPEASFELLLDMFARQLEATR